MSTNAILVAAGLEMGPLGVVPIAIGTSGMSFGFWTIGQGIQLIGADQDPCEEK